MYKFAIFVLLVSVVGGVAYYFNEATSNHKDAYVGGAVSMGERRELVGRYVLRAETISSVYVVKSMNILANGECNLVVTDRSSAKFLVKCNWIQDGDSYIVVSFVVPNTEMSTDLAFMKNTTDGTLVSSTIDSAYFGNEALTFAMTK